MCIRDSRIICWLTACAPSMCVHRALTYCLECGSYWPVVYDMHTLRSISPMPNWYNHYITRLTGLERIPGFPNLDLGFPNLGNITSLLFTAVFYVVSNVWCYCSWHRHWWQFLVNIGCRSQKQGKCYVITSEFSIGRLCCLCNSVLFHLIFIARRYASLVYAVIMCPFVCPSVSPFVCLSVCLSQVRVVQRCLNVGSH